MRVGIPIPLSLQTKQNFKTSVKGENIKIDQFSMENQFQFAQSKCARWYSVGIVYQARKVLLGILYHA